MSIFAKQGKKRIVKILIVNILISLLLIVIFDVTMFNILPSQYVYKFKGYRQISIPGIGSRSVYSKGYYTKHETRGFDIGKNKSGRHWFSELKYSIWSNSFGCFDVEHVSVNRYVYFAGDSYTWGFTPFHKKFGTIIERKTNTKILKCGVTHTGQLHQFSKFVELFKKIGKKPKAIFVFYFKNDIANDYAHPHATVVQGWRIDSKYYGKNFEIVHIPRQELEKTIADKLYEIKKNGLWMRAKRFLKFYSLSVHILKYSMDTTTKMTGMKLRTINELPYEKNRKFWYFDNPKAQRNKEAIIAFKNFSIRNNVELVFVLIPEKNKSIDTNWYEDMRKFLIQSKIGYVDLSIKFRDRNLSPKDLYWKYDGHFNPLGNKIVAEILINEFSHIFRAR